MLFLPNGKISTKHFIAENGLVIKENGFLNDLVGKQSQILTNS